MGEERNLKEEIVRLKQEGKINIEISRILNCSTDTVHYHLNPEYQIRKRQNRTIKRRDIKNRLVLKMGGKCQICGYSKCNQALQFHHLNPNEKDFEISSNYVENIDRLEKEVDKCALLCSNCHAEVEAGIVIVTRQVTYLMVRF